jgi:transcriptional regulator with XRE-family HTH domain
MGDVIGLGRKRPNGAKIANLRKEKGLKQADFAEKGKISERLLREIERRNHPVPATTITNIATALQTTPDEITLSTPDGTPASSKSLLKLSAITSAKDLNALAHDATQYEYALEVDPSSVTAEDMQCLMMIVRRLVHPWEKDEFDGQHFGDIPRLARLHQLLEQLREQEVGVIAGKYVRHSLKKKKDADFWDEPIPINPEWSIKTEFILRLHLVPAEKQEDDIQIDPGKSVDDLFKEAQRLDFKEARRPAMARSDMDDEIPF